MHLVVSESEPQDTPGSTDDDAARELSVSLLRSACLRPEDALCRLACHLWHRDSDDDRDRAISSLMRWDEQGRQTHRDIVLSTWDSSRHRAAPGFVPPHDAALVPLMALYDAGCWIAHARAHARSVSRRVIWARQSTTDQALLVHHGLGSHDVDRIMKRILDLLGGLPAAVDLLVARSILQANIALVGMGLPLSDLLPPGPSLCTTGVTAPLVAHDDILGKMMHG